MSPKSLKYLFHVDCDSNQEEPSNSYRVLLKYKIARLVAILVTGAVGVFSQIVVKNISALSPESNLFFLLKSFESLSSPCLDENPWGIFPFMGLAAMAGALGTLMIDAFATGHYRQIHDVKPPRGGDQDTRGDHSDDVQLHTHGAHGHAHGAAPLVPRV
ncbi:hypothetical protein RND81_09G115200 [Saponaria officinalis]|uniref:Uncharacterized protein n=1 Tax=Saponaria officinalis TaxID=3572 RepID=A0AAW1ILP0_SAPOF